MKTQYKSFRRFSIENNNNKLLHQINMVPFIDIMLVLLVIFMLSATEIINYIKVNLPNSNSRPNNNHNISEANSVTITVTDEGELYLNQKIITKKELSNNLYSLANNTDVSRTTIIINSDHDITYNKIMEIIMLVNKYGFKNISFAVKYNNTTPE